MKLYELKESIIKISEAKKNGKKLTYAINIYTSHSCVAIMQIVVDKIKVCGSSRILFFYHGTVSIDIDKSLFKLKFQHFYNDVIHYRLYL